MTSTVSTVEPVVSTIGMALKGGGGGGGGGASNPGGNTWTVGAGGLAGAATYAAGGAPYGIAPAIHA